MGGKRKAMEVLSAVAAAEDPNAAAGVAVAAAMIESTSWTLAQLFGRVAKIDGV